ncbi:MAG: hypothetical protein ACH346_05195, partial [Chthoniobacterales bacterium]
MKNQILRKILFLCLLASAQKQACLLAQAQTFAYGQQNSSGKGSISCAVTAAQYCDFLNHAAIESDPDHLYNEAMASDPAAACIVRVGTSGQWHYEVIAGRENFPIGYVNEVDEEKYSLEQDLPTTKNQQPTTSFLKSNLSAFAVDVSSLPMLTLAAAASTSSSNVNSYIGDVGIVALMACSVLMSGRGATTQAIDERTEFDSAARGEQVQTPVQKFREAAAHPAYTDAQRLIISGSGENLRVRSESSEAVSDDKRRSDNETTYQALKEALLAEHPEHQPGAIEEIVKNLFPKTGALIKSRPDVTVASLKEVFRQLEALPQPAKNQSLRIFTLQEFKDALANSRHHGAERLIIRGSGGQLKNAIIQAQAANPLTPNANKNEDDFIRKTLKRTLESEGHSEKYVHELTSKVLPYENSIEVAKAKTKGVLNKDGGTRLPLSSERLAEIIVKADAAKANERLVVAQGASEGETGTLIRSTRSSQNRKTYLEIFLGNLNKFLESPQQKATKLVATAKRAQQKYSQVEEIIAAAVNGDRGAAAFDEHYSGIEELQDEAQAAWDLYNSALQRIAINKKVLEWFCNLLREEKDRLSGLEGKTRADLLLELCDEALERGSGKLEKISLPGDAV